MIDQLIQLYDKYDHQADSTDQSHRDVLTKLVERHQFRMETAIRIGIPNTMVYEMNVAFNKTLIVVIDYFAEEVADYHRFYQIELNRYLDTTPLTKAPMVTPPPSRVDHLECQLKTQLTPINVIMLLLMVIPLFLIVAMLVEWSPMISTCYVYDVEGFIQP